MYLDACKIESLGDGNVKVSGRCVLTDKPYSVVVPAIGIVRWKHRGELIQNAMPNVSIDDREFLISGVSPEGWAQAFPN